MNLKLTTTTAALILIGASAANAADDVVVHAVRPVAHQSLDQRAAGACVEAFIAELRLGDSTRVRTVMPADGEAIFRSGDSMPAFYRIMRVDMTVNSAHGNDLLAKSVCKVNRDARVVHLSTQINNRAKLAGLTAEDIRMAMSIG